MGDSVHLRTGDVDAIHRLIAECRELGADARVWQRHLVCEVRRMIGCYMCGLAETVPTAGGMRTDWTTQMVIGWSDRQRQVAFELLTGGYFPPDQFCLRLSQEFARTGPLALTRKRQELIDNAEWFRSDTCEMYRLTGASDIVMSLLRISDRGRALCLGFTRGVGERALNGREARAIGLVGELLRPHLGRGLALAGEPGVAELSPRRRQVLAGLLDGLSEKEIARRLNRSLATVHEYVMALHRHFRVNSRGELLALFLRRQHGPARQWLQRFHLDD